MWRPSLNTAIGGICFGFVFGAYAYAMRSVKQTGITSVEVAEFRERAKREGRELN
jgi:hypothetical protein